MINENQEIQIIDSKLNYNEKFDSFLKENKVTDLGTNFHTVSIMGCQSSGKSTLLNLLFKTKFDIMNVNEGRYQTTKGIMFSWNKDKRILVFDVEGIDSRERKDDKYFENVTSLFALACADLLMINMWTIDVGRYTASNLGILPTIFRLHLKLFTVKAIKQICFIFRDYDDLQSKDKICNMMNEDIQTIWKELPKTKKEENVKIEDLFSFSFSFLRSLIYKKEDFNQDILFLQERFDSKNQDKYFFKNMSLKGNTPIDGYAKYISTLWVQIREQKELNLPSQKLLVAQYKCNEHKDEVLAHAEPQIVSLEKKVSEQYYPKFKEEYSIIMNLEILSFKDLCSLYPQQISESVKQILIKSLYDRLYKIFIDQMKHICKLTVDLFRVRIKALTHNSTENEQIIFWSKFEEKLKTEEKISQKFYDDKVYNTIDNKCGWDKVSHENQFKEMIQEELNNLKEKEITKIQAYLKKAYKATLIQPLNNEIMKFNNDTYSQLTNHYNDTLLQLRTLAITIYKKGFLFSETQIRDKLTPLFLEFYKIGNEEIKKIAEDLHFYASKKFKILFCRDASNKKRNFGKMTEAEIQKIYDQQTNMFLKIIDRFRYSPLFLVQETCILKDLVSESLCIPEEEKKFDSLLSINALKEIKEKFLVQAEEELDLARKNLDSFFKRLFDLPMYVWILIGFLIYEKFATILMNPLSIVWVLLFLIVVIIIEWFGLTKFIMSKLSERLFSFSKRHRRLD